MAYSKEGREAARKLEREKAVWEAARRGSKIARKMAVVQGAKKDGKKK